MTAKAGAYLESRPHIDQCSNPTKNGRCVVYPEFKKKEYGMIVYDI